MQSGKHIPQSSPSFNPASIKRYSVIRIRHKFSGSPYHEFKRFVVVGHKGDHLICIKATSQLELYRNNPERMAGCIHYKPNELPFFQKETVIQPDNLIPISYEQLIQNFKDGEFSLLGHMPGTFQANLSQAVDNSVTLSPAKAHILKNLIQQ